MNFDALMRSLRIALLVAGSSLILTNLVHAAIPGVHWTQQWGTVADDGAYGVAVDSSGNTYVTGYTGGALDGNTSAGGTDIFLTKYNADGVKQWTQQLGVSLNQLGLGVALDDTGNVYIAGLTVLGLDGNTSAGGTDIFLTKYNADGVKQWTRQLGTARFDLAFDLAIDSNGNIFITGRTDGFLDGITRTTSSADFFLAKYDSTGTQQWLQQVGGTSSDIAQSVALDGSGNAYVVGYTFASFDGHTSAGAHDIFLIKFNTDGVKQWSQQLGTAAVEHGNSVAVDSNGDAYVTGQTLGDLDGNISAGQNDLYLIKFDSSGVKQWSQQLGTISNDYANSVALDKSDNAYVTGYTQGDLDSNTSAGLEDVFLVKFDSNGVKQWTKQFGTASTDYARSVALDGVGNAYITGFTQGNLDGNTSVGGEDIFLSKLDLSSPTGSIIINNDADAASNTSVALGLSCNDGAGSGCSQMQFSNDGSDWSGWGEYATSIAWTLGNGDNSKKVHAKFRDTTGNISNSVSDTIILDTVPPEAPSVTSPADGTFSTIDSFTISGTAEAGSLVNVYDGVTTLGVIAADGIGNWSIVSGTLSEGVHSFTATATDVAGNTSAASVSVNHIVDTTAPIISPNGTDVTLEAGTSYTDAGAVATDTIDGTVNIVAVGTVNTSIPGVYTLTYDYTDAAGHVATQVTRVVTVVDTTTPVIILVGSDVIIEAGSSYTDAGAVATDFVDGAVNITAAGSINTSVPGSYTLVYDYTDAAGNAAAQITRSVTVVDTSAPLIILLGGDVTIEAGSSYTDAGAVATDFVDGTVNANVSGAMNTAVPGIYTLTYDYTDAAGNVAAQVTRTVTVVDTTAPTAPSITPLVDGASGSTTSISLSGTAELGSSIALYDGTTLLSSVDVDAEGNWSIDSGALDVGEHSFTVIATDASGNVSSVSAAITYTVESAPVSSGGGGGCTLSVTNQGEIDPLLPLLMLISSVYLWRRRRMS